eukprot:Phypoly_transcript_10686.p1 GENE.Phypoly_transcript_10686~~Phypoly_transcript_10686.p1  ORF type:complete len:299 (+),score=64.02 Phypoly_transcript_10686:334-1230(+)
MVEFKGIWPALLTPFLEGSQGVDLEAVDKLIDYLVSEGASGFYVCGSTGEGLLMSVDERKDTTARVVKRLKDTKKDIPVMVHVGALATRDAVTLSTHAKEVGAHAVSAIPPIFFDYNLTAIKEYYRAIAAACAPLPLFIYNIPSKTNFNITPAMVKEMAEEIPNLKGIKWTSMNLYEMRQIVEMGLTVFSGPDEMCLQALTMGAIGAIGSTYNVLMKHYAKLYDAFIAGNYKEAQELQYVANRVIKLWLGCPGSLKMMVGWQGVQMGKPRPPLEQPTKEKEEKLKNDLRAAGYPHPIA